MILWPLDPSEQENSKLPISRWPWLTIVLVLVVVASFFWNQSALQKNKQAIQSAQEKTSCYYLQHDHLQLPKYKQHLFPKALQEHAKKIALLEASYRNNAAERKKAQRWLHGDRWSSANTLTFKVEWDDKPSQVSCFRYARSQGLFERSHQKRIYLKLAQLENKELQEQRQDFKALINALQAKRQQLPVFRFGMVSAERRAQTIFTALFFQNDVVLLLWQVLLLVWLGATFERRWGSPFFFGAFLLSGVLAHGLLWALLPESARLIVGMGGALAFLAGVWLVRYGLGEARFHIGLPATRLKQAFSLPAILVFVLWLALFVFSTLQSALAEPLLFVPQTVCLVLGVSFGALLQKQAEDSPLLDDILEFAEPAQVYKPIKSPRQKEETTEHLMHKAQQLVSKGSHREAVNVYRQALKSGKAPFVLYRGFLSACTNARVIPFVEEYLQAIHAASFEKMFDKVRDFYQQYQAHHSDTHIAPRQRLALANDLKRAELLEEAAAQAGRIAEKGPQNPFFMQSLLLQAECMLKLIEEGSLNHLSPTQNKEVVEVVLQLYGANEYLQLYPEYAGKLKETQAKAEELLGDFVTQIVEAKSRVALPAYSEDKAKGVDSQENAQELFEALSNLGKDAASFTWADMPAIRETNLEEDPLMFDFETWSDEWDIHVDGLVSATYEAVGEPEPLSRDSLHQAERIVASPDMLEDLMAQPWKMESQLEDAVQNENVMLLTEELVDEHDPELGMLAPIVGTLIEEAPEPIRPSAPPVEMYDVAEPGEQGEGGFDFDGWSGEWDQLIEEAQAVSQEALTAIDEEPIVGTLLPSDHVVTSPGMLEDLMAQPWKMESQLYEAIDNEQATVLAPEEYEGDMDLVLGVLLEDPSEYETSLRKKHSSVNHHLDIGAGNGRKDLTTLELDQPIKAADTNQFFSYAELEAMAKKKM